MDKRITLARNLRKNMTPQEHKLWKILRNRQFKNLAFKRQYPIGNYIVDFICKEKWLIIEIDGGQHNTPEAIEYDNNRTEYLESRGFTVLRFWNNEIDNELDGVFFKIDEFTK